MHLVYSRRFVGSGFIDSCHSVKMLGVCRRKGVKLSVGSRYFRCGELIRVVGITGVEMVIFTNSCLVLEIPLNLMTF